MRTRQQNRNYKLDKLVYLTSIYFFTLQDDKTQELSWVGFVNVVSDKKFRIFFKPDIFNQFSKFKTHIQNCEVLLISQL